MGEIHVTNIKITLGNKENREEKKTKQNRKSKIYRNGNKRNTDIEDKIKKHVEMEEGIRQIL